MGFGNGIAEKKIFGFSRVNLVLVIETSSSPFGVVLGEGNNVLFNSPDDACLRGKRDLSLLVYRGLNFIGKRPNDIGTIAVNVGPGGLTSVRSGVGFANALAFALGIPVCPFTSFELSGFEAWKNFQLPVLCTARASKGNAYVGLYDNGAVTVMRFGLLEIIAREVTSELGEFIVAGAHREYLRELLASSKIHDSGVQLGQAKTFLEMKHLISKRGYVFPYLVSPINEQSKVFYE